jgi:hypothetical protein
MSRFTAPSQMVGATVLDVFAVTDRFETISEVHVVTDRGLFVADAEADCCGHAWIDEVEVGTAIGGTITGINTIDKDSVEGDYGDVRDSFTEVVSTTNGDMALFSFCAHNGYYSGWINWNRG